MTSKHARIASILLAASLLACQKKTAEPVVVADAEPPPKTTTSAKPVDAIPVPSASVMKVVNPTNLPAYAGDVGSVEGTIRVEGPPAPDAPPQDYSACPDAKDVYGKLFREGAPGPDGSRPLADAVVAVTGYSGYYVPEKDEARTIAIVGCAFNHRTLTMTFGQRLDVQNQSDAFWAPAFEQIMTPALMVAAPHTPDPVKLYPPKPGWYSLVDRMKHPYAHADVFVLLQPLHTVSDVEGHYRIDGIPVGKRKLNVRLAAIGTESRDVDVLAGVVQHVDVKMRYEPKDAGAPAASPATKGDAGRPSEILK